MTDPGQTTDYWKNLTHEERVTWVKGMAWIWEVYAPRLAKLHVQEFGPLGHMSPEETEAFLTKSFREGIYAPGVDIEKAHAEALDLLARDGHKPEPYPWMIDNYKKRGIIMEGA